MRGTSRRQLLVVATLALALWLPRGLALDRLVTVDEPTWLTFSGNFYRALAHGDFRHTFQIEHPGVTTSWIGAAALWWRYPSYARDAGRQYNWTEEEIGPLLRAHGQDPVRVLATARTIMVVVITAVLLLASTAAVRLVGLWSGLLGFALLAADPFHIALSRVLHVDALAGSFVLLSLLAVMNFFYNGRRRVDLVVSAAAAGLAWLTKAPTLVLVPFVGALALHGAVTGFPEQGWRARVGRAAGELAAWGAIAFAVFVLLWPAMWVEPVRSMGTVVGQAIGHARSGHREAALFFNGRVLRGDPGPLFYPITYLWRTTPVVLIGLALTAFGYARPRLLREEAARRRAAGVLVLFALVFTLMMTFGAKKFDRYLLPAYAPLDLVAGMGWVMAARWVGARGLGALSAALVAGVALAGQFAMALPAFPYYFSYYNPLLGGPSRAPQVMMVGWGEGLDQAARYLNARPNAERLRVAAWVWNGTFSYFFSGRILPGHFAADSVSLHDWLQTDYGVLYINQRQRRRLPPGLEEYLERLDPVLTVRLQGLEYARVYDLRNAPLPGHMARFLPAPETGAGGQSGLTR